jgi:hypothetical protein
MRLQSKADRCSREPNPARLGGHDQIAGGCDDAATSAQVSALPFVSGTRMQLTIPITPNTTGYHACNTSLEAVVIANAVIGTANPPDAE